MHKAVEKNMLEMVEIFLKNGADGNVKNNQGYTVLHVAAKEGHVEMCELLLNHGVDPDIRDRFGLAASHWAKQNEHQKIVELLPSPLKLSKEEFINNLQPFWNSHHIDVQFRAKGKKKKGKKKK